MDTGKPEIGCIQERIVTAIWGLFHRTIGNAKEGRPPENQAAVVQALHSIALEAAQALAATSATAQAEKTALLRKSLAWPVVFSQTSKDNSTRLVARILDELGMDAPIDLSSAGTASGLAASLFHLLENERRKHLWENLTPAARAVFSKAASDGETPEDAHQKFKADHYPAWKAHRSLKRDLQKHLETGPRDQRTQLGIEIKAMDSNTNRIRWIYAAGLLEPLTKGEVAKWKDAAVLMVEAESPDGDIMGSPLLPESILKAARKRETEKDRRAGQARARSLLKKHLTDGFRTIAKREAECVVSTV